MTGMGSRVVRSLVLACSLHLALPQGWCCSSACPTTEATTPLATAAGADTEGSPGDPGGGCPFCTKHQPGPSSDPPDQPTPADNPSAPCKSVCPCADRHATTPASAAGEQLDTGF